MGELAMNGLVVIGCGDFGAAVAGCLEARSGRPESVQIVKLPSLGGATRSRAADKFREMAGAGWPELGAAVKRATGSAIGLVAAADDVTGGGVAVAALEWVAKAYPQSRRVLWLLLPGSGSGFGAGGAKLSRAWATLLELEALKEQPGWHRCFLAERRSEDQDAMGAQAAQVADAMLVYSQGMPVGSGYAGFGVGLVRGERTALADQILPVVLRRMAGREDAVAPQAFDGAAFRAALHRLTEFMLDLDATLQRPYLQDRWALRDGRQYLFSLKDPGKVEDLKWLIDEVQSSLESHYRRDGRVVREAEKQWAALCESVKADITALIRRHDQQAPARVMEELHAEVERLRRETDVLLSKSRERAPSINERRRELYVQLDDLLKQNRGFRILGNDLPERRAALAVELEANDRDFAAHYAELFRQSQMSELLLFLDSKAREMENHAQAREAEEERLQLLKRRAAEEAERAEAAVGPLAPPHVLAPVLSDEDRARAGELLVVPVVQALGARLRQDMGRLAESVRTELEAQMRRVGPHAAVLQQAVQNEEQWLSLIQPSLRFGPQPPGYAVRLSQGMPQRYVDALKRLPRWKVLTNWVTARYLGPDTDLVYVETDAAFPLSVLASAREMEAAYAAADTALSTLHVVAVEAPAVVQVPAAVRSPAAVPAAAALAAAPAPGAHTGPTLGAHSGPAPAATPVVEPRVDARQAILRGLLLGMVRPVDGGPDVVVRTLSADRQEIWEGRFLSLDQLLKAAAADSDLGDRLSLSADLMIGAMDERQLADYGAFADWFRGADPLHLPSCEKETIMGLKAAARNERRELGSAAGGRPARSPKQPVDAITVKAGTWRYFKW